MSIVAAVVVLPVSSCPCDATAGLSAVILLVLFITASDVDVTGSICKGPVELLPLDLMRTSL